VTKNTIKIHKSLNKSTAVITYTWFNCCPTAKNKVHQKWK